VDALGDTLRWKDPPRRIVSLSPNLTETLFALGIGARGDQQIVGVTRFCDTPAEARDIPDVGGIVDPSLEAVLARDPDLVVVTRGNPMEFIEALHDLGIPTYAVETRGRLVDLVESLRRLGHAVGRGRRADAWADSLRAEIRALEERTGALGPDRRPRVYFGSLEPPLWTAGPGSMIDDLIRLAGGKNVAADAPRAWVVYSLERIVAANPEVYLGTFPDGREEAVRREVAETLFTTPGLRDTEMGRATRICLLPEDLLLRPGPRIVRAAQILARCLHPELYPRDRRRGRR
jgi:iron complex transport system substrate-binding protein